MGLWGRARVVGAAAPGGAKWRRAVDQQLKTATSVQEVLDGTLHVIPAEVLDAPPSAEPLDPEDNAPQRFRLDDLPRRGAGFSASDPVLEQSPAPAAAPRKMSIVKPAGSVVQSAAAPSEP